MKRYIRLVLWGTAIIFLVFRSYLQERFDGDAKEVSLTAWEIADLFYTTAGVIHSRIKAILRANILKEYEVCQCIRLENGNYADMYNRDMIIALSYQMDTGHSAAFRKWIINKVASKQNGISLFIPIKSANTYNC